MLEPVDSAAWEEESARLNFEPMLNGWKPQSFRFLEEYPEVIGNGGFATTGALMVSELMADAFRALQGTNLELLPVFVEGEHWYVVNCLAAVHGIDKVNSAYVTALDGRITTVKRFVIDSSAVAELTVFCLAETERGQLFFSHDCIGNFSKLSGVAFRCVGEAC